MAISRPSRPFVSAVCPVLFLVDVSRRQMDGEWVAAPCGAIDVALRSSLGVLRNLNNNNRSIKFYTAVMAFGATFEWVGGNSLVDPEQLLNSWRTIGDNYGNKSTMANVFTELNRVMSLRQFMHNAGGNVNPIIVLLSDGRVLGNAWSSILENVWYNYSIRIVVRCASGVPGNIEKRFLNNFTGSKRLIFDFCSLLQNANGVSSILSNVLNNVSSSILTSSSYVGSSNSTIQSSAVSSLERLWDTLHR